MLLTLEDLKQEASGDPRRALLAAEGRIIVGDCLEALSLLPSDSVDLVHTSPPYNIDRPYKGQGRDLHPLEAYLEFLEAVATQLKRVLKPNGSLFWQTGYTQLQNGVQGDILPIDIVSYRHFHDPPAPLVLWDRIIWRYFGGMAFKRKFTNRHETILWYVKPTPEGVAEPYFDVDQVRESTRDLDKRNNFWGRNPGNVWEVDRVAFGSIQQSSHIAVYPEEVAERIVRACSQPGALVLDPFSGSGTTPKVSRSLGRRWIGIEVVEEYAKESVVRIGYQQPSEPLSLASAIIKHQIFGGRRGTVSVQSVASQLAWWLGGVDLARIREDFDEIACAALSDDSAAKLVKRRAWRTLENWIRSDPPRDAVVLADRLLSEEYRLRRAWNGARRYRTALEHLEALFTLFSNCTDHCQFVLSLVQNEPSSFRLHEGAVELREPRRRLKERPLSFFEERSRVARLSSLANEDESEAYQRRLPI